MTQNWLHETEDVEKAVSKVWEDMQYGRMPEQHSMATVIGGASDGHLALVHDAAYEELKKFYEMAQKDIQEIGGRKVS